MGQYTVILMKYSTWSGVPPRGRVGSVNVNPLGSPRPPALPSFLFRGPLVRHYIHMGDRVPRVTAGGALLST